MKVVLDIETVQAPRDEWRRLVGIEEPATHGPLEGGYEDLFDHAEQQERLRKEEEQYQRSAFDGTFSRIVCIGLLTFSDAMAPQGAFSWFGRNEPELLRQFWSKLGELRPSLFITHNGLGFDFPFLKKRSIIHQIPPPFEIPLAKFRSEPVFDTMAIWSNWDMRGWVKLDVLARALNVETKSGSGAQVAEMWAAEEGRAIAEYCLQDTYVTYACYQRMTYQPLLPRQAVLRAPTLIDVG